MISPKAYLDKLQKNSEILRERQAKFGVNAPLELINQVEDHKQAILLTEQALRGEISESQWREALSSLLSSLDRTQVIFDQRGQQVETQYNVAGEINIGGDVRYHREIFPSVPLQRPLRASHFINREMELQQLLTELQPGRVITLCGPGGIGKSALVAEAIWRLAPDDKPPERFPDGIIFHSFYNQPQAVLALEAIALAFGEEPQPTPRDAARRALSNRRALLFLDGTENADDLQTILQIAGSCGVIVTSRRQEDALDKRTDLMPLNADDAVLLLRSWGENQVGDTPAARRIIELVGGLPLAVRLVGRYLAQTQSSASEYLEWLAETPLDALDLGKRQSESIEVLLSRSLTRVSEKAREVLGIAGVLALAPFSREVIEASLPKVDVRHALGELINYGLLIRNQKAYEISNALIYSYVRKRINAPDEQVINLSKYYITLSKELNALGPKGFTRLDVERAHLVTVLSRCIERELWDIAQSLVWAIGTPEGYFALQGYWVEWIRSLEAGLVASRTLKHSQDEAAFLDFLGIAYRSLGQVNKAIEYHKEALVIARERDDQQKECANLGDLGLAYSDLGQVEKAVEYYQQALTLAREIGDRRVEGINLGNLGIAYRDLGEVEQAIEYLEQALSISRNIGDLHREGEILGNLGLTYSDLGRSNEAIECYQQALTLAREIGDRRNEGTWLGNLGLAYHNLGQVEQAIEYYEQALTIAREIGDRRNEGNWLGNLGNVHSSEGVVDKAIEYYEQALSITREIDDIRREGNWLGSLGNAYYLIRDDQKAIEHYQQALTIAREVGDRYREGNWLGNLGLVHYSLGQIELSKSYLDQALVIFEDIKSPYAEHIRQLLSRVVDGSFNMELASNATVTFYSTEKMTPKYLSDSVLPYFQAVADFQYLINEIRNQPQQEVEILSLTKGSVGAVVSGATDAIKFIMEIVVPWRYEHAQTMAKLDEAEKHIHIEDTRADILLKRLQRQKDKEKAEIELEKERAELEKVRLENEKMRAGLERDRVNFYREKIQWALDIVEKIQPGLDGTAKIDYATRLLKPLEVLAKSDLELVDYTLPSLPSPKPLGLTDSSDDSEKS